MAVLRLYGDVADEYKDMGKNQVEYAHYGDCKWVATKEGGLFCTAHVEGVDGLESDGTFYTAY